MQTDRKERNKLHARRRSKERFDIKLSKKLKKTIISDIEAGRARFFYRRGKHAVYGVVVKKQYMHVVYNRSLNELVTFLYPKPEVVVTAYTKAVSDYNMIKRYKTL